MNGIRLPQPTQDQAEYLERIRAAGEDYDGSTIIGGPKTMKAERSFWLLERYMLNRLHYWSAGARGRGHADDWSEDISFATKFFDQESADQVMCSLCGREGRTVEHSIVAA